MDNSEAAEGRNTQKRRMVLKYVAGEKPLPDRDFNFDKFCQRMNFHGLTDWQNAQSIMAKCFWGIMVICSILILFFQTYQEAGDYVRNPILTTISFVPTNEIPFPEMYVCPMDFANWEYISRKGDREAFLLKTAIFRQNFGSILQGKSSRWQKLAPYMQIMNAESREPDPIREETFQEFLITHAIPVDTFLITCRFESEEFPCSAIAEPIVDKEYGICFLLDLKKRNGDLQVFQKNPGLGFIMVIDIKQEQYPSSPYNKQQTLIDGAVIRIGEQIDPATYDGLLLHPGTYARFALTARKIHLKEVIRSTTPQRCTKERSLRIIDKVPYSIDTCRLDCGMQVLIEKCNCIMPIDNRYLRDDFSKKFKICTTELFDSCVLPAFENTEKEKLHACTSHCHRACDKTVIEASASYAAFPSITAVRRAATYLKWEARNSSYCRSSPTDPFDIHNTPRWKDNFIIVDIAFDQLEYIKIMQNPSRTMTSLVSNIGGQAGLWTGASIFTLVQLLTFLIYLVYTKLFNTKRLKDLILP